MLLPLVAAVGVLLFLGLGGRAAASELVPFTALFRSLVSEARVQSIDWPLEAAQTWPAPDSETLVTLRRVSTVSAMGDEAAPEGPLLCTVMVKVGEPVPASTEVSWNALATVSVTLRAIGT